MPLPLLLLAAVGAAVVTAAIGIGKGAKAVIDYRSSKKNNEEANYNFKVAKRKLDKDRRRSKKSLEKLGNSKIEVLGENMTRFVNAFEKIKNIEVQNSVGLEELSKFKKDKTTFTELKELGDFASSILSGVASGATGGAITAFGAYSAAAKLAAASTGTLISSLSGAAATNATLAFFGGGSLAAGGAGVAGGAIVLGGLVAGPALAIMGFIVEAKANKMKEESLSNLAKSKSIILSLNTASDLCNAISERSNMFVKLLDKLNTRFEPVVSMMETAIEQNECNFAKFSEEQKKTTAAAASLAVSIKTVIDTPILTEDGNLTKESETLLSELQ